MTMDHCLRIPEVVWCICETLDGRTALSLALVQKAFLEPALDRVWRHLTSFEPLVACLPDDLLRGEEKDMFLGPTKGPSQVMFLERALKLSDLQRYLNFYSHRVKSFRLGPETCRTWPSIEVLQAMQIATDWAPGALAPRLEDFLWLAPYQLLQVYGEAMASHFPLCMPLFFGPTVTSMELQIHVHNPLYTSFVDSVSKNLPSQLKKLRIEIEDTQEDESEEEKTFPFVHEYLTRSMWPKLEELRVGGFCVSPALASSLFRHLATLPRMAVLELEDFVDAPLSDNLEESDPAPIDQPTIGVDGFESLKRLRLSCDGISGVTRFLQCLPPTNGVTHLECECYYLTSSEDAQHAIDAMQHHLNPLALQELTLAICYFGDGDEGIRLEREEDGTLDTTPLLAASSGHDDSDGLVIDALLAFHKLVKLQLQVGGRIRLTPELVGQLPTAWPYIRQLNISTSHPPTGSGFSHTFTSVTWRTIWPLALLVWTSILVLYLTSYGVPDLVYTFPQTHSRFFSVGVSLLDSVAPQCEFTQDIALYPLLECGLASVWARWQTIVGYLTSW